MNLSRLLIAYRQKYDIPSKDLAEKLGISPSTLSRLESGKEVTATNLVSIMNWLIEPCEPIPEKE